MRPWLPIVLGWAATLGGAFVLGREMAPKGPSSDVGGPGGSAMGGPEGGAGVGSDVRSSGTAGESPRLVAAGGAGRTTGPRPTGSGGGVGLVKPVVGEVGSDQPLELDGVTTTEEFMKRFLAYASAQLAAGPEGHKTLYKKLVALMSKDGQAEKLFGSEEAALPYAYPMLRFAMDRDAQVADMFETLLVTGAKEPAFFQGDEKDDALEMFVEGLGYLMPGAVSAQRLDRLRGHAKEILAQDEATQPRALRGVRGDLERVVATWLPPLTSAQAVARLKEGGLKGRELLSVLRRVEPADRAQLDLVALLGPLLSEGDGNVMFELGRMELQPGEIATLDDHLLEGAAQRKVPEWRMIQWLQQTRRAGWPVAKPFVEKGMRRGQPASEAVALMLRQLQPQPSAAEVDDLLRTYSVGDRVAGSVRQQFGIR